MALLHDLITFYDNTDSGDVYHDAARIILRNLNQLENLSINALAEVCFVSTTTINRLVRKLGSASYGDFKRDISREIAEYPMLNRCAPYELSVENNTAANYLELFNRKFQSLVDSLCDEELDKVAEMIHNASRVCLYMEFATMHSKRIFQYDLVMSGKDTSFWGDNERLAEEASTLEKGDVVLTYWGPHTQYSEKAELLKEARKHGAKTIVLSSKAVPNAGKYADYLVEFEGTRTAMDQYFVDLFFSILTCRYRYKYIDQ